MVMGENFIELKLFFAPKMFLSVFEMILKIDLSEHFYSLIRKFKNLKSWVFLNSVVF